MSLGPVVPSSTLTCRQRVQGEEREQEEGRGREERERKGLGGGCGRECRGTWREGKNDGSGLHVQLNERFQKIDWGEAIVSEPMGELLFPPGP